MTTRVVALVVIVVVTFGSSAVGALSRPGAWYAALERPPLTPPSWIFAPVWTMLYLLMSGAAWLAWDAGTRREQVGAVRVALGVYVVQLLLNAAWSPLFFRLHRPDLALVDILLLLAAIAGTIVAFARLSTPAAWMLVPYLLWVSFATYLNAGFWWLNRG